MISRAPSASPHLDKNPWLNSLVTDEPVLYTLEAQENNFGLDTREKNIVILNPMILRHLPNALTISRLVLIAPFLLCLYEKEYVTAFYIFVIAGLTDGLDGWLARLFRWQSALGSFVDPLADKLLIAASFISLALIEKLPWWLVILVFLRDITILLGVVAWHWFVQRKLKFNPTLLSKLNTVLQLALVTLCLFELGFFQFPAYIINTLIILTAATTASSYIDYVWTWGKKACFNLRTSK